MFEVLKCQKATIHQTLENIMQGTELKKNQEKQKQTCAKKFGRLQNLKIEIQKKNS